MKKIALIVLLVFASVMTRAQDLTKMVGIDHEKKIVVATGRLLDGMRPYSELMKVRGENYTFYRSEMPLITITTDGPIVNSPAVHGIINVADADGNVITMHAGFKIGRAHV